MLIHILCAGVGDKEVFDFFCQRYYSQYIDLREFYSKVPFMSIAQCQTLSFLLVHAQGSNINSLATIVPIPMLPAVLSPSDALMALVANRLSWWFAVEQDPPQFVTSGGFTLEGQTRKRRQRTSSKGKASTGQTSPQAKVDLFAPPPSSKRQPPPSNLGNRTWTVSLRKPIRLTWTDDVLFVLSLRVTAFLGVEDQRVRSSSAPGWVTFAPSFNPPPPAVPALTVSQFPPVSAGRPQAETPTQPPPQATRPRAEATRVWAATLHLFRSLRLSADNRRFLYF